MGRARRPASTPKSGVLRVAAYVRVSTDEQAESGLGLADQQSRCEGMAAGKGWPAPTVYRDAGVSGTKEPKERPALAELGRTTGDRGGRLPYGYRRQHENGVVKVDPVAAGTVRRIFSARRRGESLREIARKLNEAKAPAPRGGPWRHTTVASILANRALYAGGRRADSLHRWPAILGQRTQEEVA